MDERVTTSINASSYLSVVKRQLKNLKVVERQLKYCLED
jgi:hypothetical protein